MNNSPPFYVLLTPNMVSELAARIISIEVLQLNRSTRCSQFPTIKDHKLVNFIDRFFFSFWSNSFQFLFCKLRRMAMASTTDSMILWVPTIYITQIVQDLFSFLSNWPEITLPLGIRLWLWFFLWRISWGLWMDWFLKPDNSDPNFCWSLGSLILFRKKYLLASSSQTQPLIFGRISKIDFNRVMVQGYSTWGVNWSIIVRVKSL